MLLRSAEKAGTLKHLLKKYSNRMERYYSFKKAPYPFDNGHGAFLWLEDLKENFSAGFYFPGFDVLFRTTSSGCSVSVTLSVVSLMYGVVSRISRARSPI